MYRLYNLEYMLLAVSVRSADNARQAMFELFSYITEFDDFSSIFQQMFAHDANCQIIFQILANDFQYWNKICHCLGGTDFFSTNHSIKKQFSMKLKKLSFSLTSVK